MPGMIGLSPAEAGFSCAKYGHDYETILMAKVGAESILWAKQPYIFAQPDSILLFSEIILNFWICGSQLLVLGY